MKIFACLMLASTFAAAPVWAQGNFTIPPNAISSGNLSPSNQWFWTHDTGTPGSSVGTSEYPATTPSGDGLTREFDMSYSDHAGERYSVDFGRDTQSTHFVYDVYVYFNNPSQLANLELDVNQVMANGQTVIYAFQCSGNAGAWEYTTVSGTTTQWHRTSVACSPSKFAAYEWHRIKIASHRDSTGTVTFDWVFVDGVYNTLTGATGNGAIDLKWAPGALNLNFQLDGSSANSSSATVYAGALTIYRW